MIPERMLQAYFFACCLLLLMCLVGIAAGTFGLAAGQPFPDALLWGAVAAIVLLPLPFALQRLVEMSLKFGDKELVLKLQESLEETKAEVTKAAAAAESAKTGSISAVLKPSPDLDAAEQRVKHAIAAALPTEPTRNAFLTDLPATSSSAEDLRALASTDPTKGQFGGRAVADGRKLSAKVAPLGTEIDYFRVDITVESLPGSAPLVGVVSFFLHPTFPTPILRANAENGRATVTVLAWGAFTVGVLCDEGRVTLELDLCDPQVNAPSPFRDR